MPHAELRSARRKLARAKEHIDDLDKLVTGYGGACLVPGRSRDSPGMGALVVRVFQKPPTNVPELVGDAVHNLRTSLDHLAVGVVELNKRPSKSVHFPFCEKAADLDDMIKRKNFHRASPEAQDLLRSLKPYPGGNDALRGLHDLDLLDKHNRLVTTLEFGTLDNLQTSNLNLKDMGIGLHDGFAPIAMPMIFLSEIRGVIPLRLSAHLGAGPFANQEVLPTLRSLSDLCDGIFEAFSALYSR